MNTKRSKCENCGRIRCHDDLEIIVIPRSLNALFDGKHRIYFCVNHSSYRQANNLKSFESSCKENYFLKSDGYFKNVRSGMTFFQKLLMN